MVFCASCNPWPRAIAAADPDWEKRKPRPTRPGLRRRKVHKMMAITANARVNPTSGESTIGMTTLSTSPPHFTWVPDARAAPTRPPISPCEEEDGSPARQVTRFQAMPPNSAAATTTRPPVPLGTAMMPLPTVAATPVPSRAPTKFIDAPRASAMRGVSARVDTLVAMAFEASWNPLVKSKPRATTTMAASPSHCTSGRHAVRQPTLQGWWGIGTRGRWGGHRYVGHGRGSCCACSVATVNPCAIAGITPQGWNPQVSWWAAG